MAMGAMVLGLASCKQEDNPQYHAPKHFKVNTPAFQNETLVTNGDQTNKSSFNLFCSQPDYGYSAICNYSALCSLNPDAPIEEWTALPNSNPTSAAIAIPLYELAVAINTQLGAQDEQDFNNRNLGATPYQVFFRAVCEIPGIEGSRIVSENYVSYNKVQLAYAEKKPGWVYICGDVVNLTTGVANGFTGPAASAADLYDANFRLYEPDNMIGEKVYVGVFGMTPKVEDSSKSYEDNCSQFRFFTELLGWKADASYGSNKADFFCLSITDKYETGYSGKVVAQGLGNWGIWCCDHVDPVPVTIVFDLVQLQIYVQAGEHNVTFTGRTPTFE